MPIGSLVSTAGGAAVPLVLPLLPDKVMCHLMFGILSFTVLQLVRLVT